MIRDKYIEFLLDVTRAATWQDASRQAAFKITGDLSRANSWREVDDAITAAMGRLGIVIDRIGALESAKIGRLSPRTGGFRLQIRRDLPKPTYRLTLAHELAHTLSYDVTEPTPVRQIRNSRVEEICCDTIARRILVPPASIPSAPPETPLAQLLGIATTMGKSWLISPWEVLRLYSHLGMMDDIVGVLWRFDGPNIASVSEYIAPLGIFIPARDRARLDEPNNRLLWSGIRSALPISNQTKLEIGSLRGEFESSVIISRRLEAAIQLVRLDSKHMAKASAWARARGGQTQIR